jgi:hypothetical protein
MRVKKIGNVLSVTKLFYLEAAYIFIEDQFMMKRNHMCAHSVVPIFPKKDLSKNILKEFMIRKRHMCAKFAIMLLHRKEI